MRELTRFPATVILSEPRDRRALASEARAFDLAHIHHFGDLAAREPRARPGAFGIILGQPPALGATVVKKDAADTDAEATYSEVKPAAPDPMFSWYRVIVGIDGIVLGIGAGTEEHCDAKAALLTGLYRTRWGAPQLMTEPLKAKQDANLNVAWVFPGLKASADADARQGLFLMGESTPGGCYLEYMLGDASLIPQATPPAPRNQCRPAKSC